MGATGRNFAAGMSGGVAYVYDTKRRLPSQCNKEMVEIEPLDAEDFECVRGLLTKHADLTGSPLAQTILKDWDSRSQHLVKVMPRDYKKALQQLAKQTEDVKEGLHEKQREKEEEPPVQDIEEIAVPVGRHAKVMGFKTYKRREEDYRETEERASDFEEIFSSQGHDRHERKKQAARCMDCGVPFCQSETGCPINNLIPEFNDLVPFVLFPLLLWAKKLKIFFFPSGV